jgi:DNA-binding ferritin-like protein
MAPKFASSPYGESQQVVWHDPTTYDPIKHAPPYMPEARAPLTASQKQAVRKTAFQRVNPKEAVSLYPEMTPLSSLLAVLQAASLIHKTHHWQTSGGSSYGDHLLFDRLYADSQEFIDQVAERAVGTDHVGVVDVSAQTKVVSMIVGHLCDGSTDPSRLVEISLKAESLVLQAIDLTVSRLKGSGTLSNGTDNLLQGVADQHETFVYLLKQRSASQATYSYAR